VILISEFLLHSQYGTPKKDKAPKKPEDNESH